MSAKRRAAAVAPFAVAVLLALTSCSGPPGAPTGGASESHELTGTTWAGTDSDGDDWVFDFEEDGTVAVTLNGQSYDDPSDTWRVSGRDVTITVNGGEELGQVVHTGRYAGLDEPMGLEVETTVGGLGWTITLERRR